MERVSWMPTKKYLVERVNQLKEELDQATSRTHQIRDTDQTEAMEELTLQLKAAEERVQELLAANAKLEARLEAAEASQQRWLERELRWVAREEKLEQTISQLSRERDETTKRAPPPSGGLEETGRGVEGMDHTSPTSGKEAEMDPETAPVGRPPVSEQKLPNISMYSGANIVDDDETIEDWLDQFELIADVFSWDDSTHLMHLTTHLKGNALAFYRSCSKTERRSYLWVCDALKRKFTPVHVQSVQSARFHGRVQEPQETVDSYGQELKRLFQRAYPKMSRDESQEGKSVLASRFVAGLRREIQEKLTGLEEDFDVLLQRARFEEAKRKELGKDAEHSHSLSRVARTCLGGDRSNGTSTGGRSRGSQRNFSRGRNRGQQPRTCNRCGSEEHFVKDCPLRARTEPTEATYQRSATKVKVLNAEGVAGLETEMATMLTLEAREGRGERIGPRITVEVEVEGLPVTAVVDTGSPVSIISSLCLFDLYRRKAGPGIDWKEDVRQVTRPPTTAISLKGYNSTPIGVAAEADLNIK